MARGNDGNLMQHAIEAELVTSLATGQGMYLLTTHSMAPFEPFDPRGEDQDKNRWKRFDYWWKRALSDPQADDPNILKAYRLTRQRQPELYPNTAEVAAELIGRGTLCGNLIEVDGPKCNALHAAWAKNSLTVHEGSWRAELRAAVPDCLECPWLFSLDPMTYVATYNRDDNQFHPADFEALAGALDKLCATKQPGAMVLFCYSMWPDAQRDFRAAAENCLASFEARKQLHLRFAKVAFGRTAHVAAVATTREELAEAVCESWIKLRNYPLSG